ncbi:hypothetical protein L13192_06014 [Pyrenophora tritici-repentis]|nr:hypothetical protein Ptr86124_003880 [Pyrenophora tritici-repentis]KAI1670498.1 hypothetical protein L13192_06014 [Pyrenophora tritici-repentis]KAI1682123.1 hypothetical protein KJE20_08994 [Pyrenophora tritici-repentis]
MRALEQPSELEQAFSQEVETNETALPAPSFSFTSNFDSSLDNSDNSSESSSESEDDGSGTSSNGSITLNQGNGQQTATPPTTIPAPPATLSRLPLHIQTQIWTLALPKPRTRILELHTYNTIDHLPRLIYHPPLPSLFSVCRASRSLSITHDGGEIVTFTTPSSTLLFHSYGETTDTTTTTDSTDPNTSPSPSFYLKPTLTILFLPARFTASCRTPETARLRTLTTLFHPNLLSRLSRLLISFSGTDNFSAIGPVLRPYARLETLYLCMNDLRVDMRVRRLVRQGFWGRDLFAARIARVLRETEDEETDDESEGVEVARVREEVRERRRVVEVDLLLGF